MLYTQTTTGAGKGTPAMDTLTDAAVGLATDTLTVTYYPNRAPAQEYTLRYKTSDGHAYDFSETQDLVRQSYPSAMINAFIRNSDAVDSEGYWTAYFTDPITMIGIEGSEGAVTAMGPFASGADEYKTPFTSVIVPDGTVKLSGYDESAFSAFSNDSALKSVSLPSTLTEIGMGAFANTNLSSITIPDSVTTIGAIAFYGAFDWFLTAVTLGSGVTTIGDDAFSGNINLESLTIPASIQSIGNHIIYENLSMESIAILAETPPAIESGTFDVEGSIKELLIYVPSASVTVYKDAWPQYADMIQSI